jgi:fibronectin-binding autotransporter adhesin
LPRCSTTRWTIPPAAPFINDGTVVVVSGVTVFGDIDVTGSSTISGASLNKGGVTVESGQTLTLDDVTVSGTAFDDTASGAKLSVGSGDTLTLQDGATVTGGSLVDSGTVQVETTSGARLDGVSVSGGGAIAVDQQVVTTPPATLTLVKGTSITGGTLTIGKVGTVDVESAAGATLEGVDVFATNSTSTIAVGISGAAKLTLDGSTTVNGGKLSIGSGSTLAIDAAAVPGTHATVLSRRRLRSSAGLCHRAQFRDHRRCAWPRDVGDHPICRPDHAI